MYSIDVIRGIKGASFVLSCMCEAQKAPIDMLMYYDTRPGVLCGLFDYYTCKPQKAYYPFCWYGNHFYKKGKEVQCTEIENVYTLCRSSEDGKLTAMLTYYSDDDASKEIELHLNFSKDSRYEVYLLDQNHNGELLCVTNDLTFTLSVHSCLLILEI